MTAAERVTAAARQLFAERGYGHVTVRQIAAEASVSPAMVMKIAGSKEALFAMCEPPAPEPMGTAIPREQLGTELVRRILSRRDTAAAEPWMQALLLTVDSPDPAAARAAFRDRHIAFLRGLVGDAPDADARAELLAVMLIGLAAGARTMRLLQSEADVDWTVGRYGHMVQSLLDRPERPDASVRT
jgi:AcrR family transcriptional regulator